MEGRLAHFNYNAYSNKFRVVHLYNLWRSNYYGWHLGLSLPCLLILQPPGFYQRKKNELRCYVLRKTRLTEVLTNCGAF